MEPKFRPDGTRLSSTDYSAVTRLGADDRNWVRKGVAKVSWNPGQFQAVLVLIETVGGGSDGTRFKQRTGGKPGVQCWAFSVTKESVMEGVSASSLITDLASGVVSSVLTYFSTRSKIRLDMIVEYDKTLHDKSLDLYKELWPETELLARFKPHFVLTYSIVKAVAEGTCRDDAPRPLMF